MTTCSTYDKRYYFVYVGVDKMLYLTRALSAILQTRVIMATRLRLVAQNSHSTIQKALLTRIITVLVIICHANKQYPIFWCQ